MPQSFDSKYLKTVTDTRLDPGYLYVGPMGFRLAPSDMTLDDLEGLKIKVILRQSTYMLGERHQSVGADQGKY